jgi:hypothetical protein
VPDPVGYDTYGPISFPLPKEIQDLLKGDCNKTNFINITSIRVDNYSSKIQKEIRVLYNGNYLYEPRFKFHRRDIPVKVEVRYDEKEFVITEIPPNESVSIEIFYPSKDFGVVQALYGEREITSLMQKLTEARRNPGLARLKLSAYLITIITVVAVSISGYVAWNKRQENARIEEVYSEFNSCSPSFIKNPPENEIILEKNFKRLDMYWQDHILSSNKVKSFEELNSKDELFWCEPQKP